MKLSTILKLSATFLIAFVLLFTGCSKDDDAPSKTELLCRTWIVEKSDTYETFLTYHNDGTALIDDIYIPTNNHSQFYYTWKWIDEAETTIATKSNKTGVEWHDVIIRLTEKELTIKKLDGSQVTYSAK